MWPVMRSTMSQGPGCQAQRTASPGRESLMWRARRMTKVRSVTSWTSPTVHSFWMPSTKSGADAEAGGFFGFVVGVGFGRGVGDLAAGPRVTRVDFGGLGGGGDRAERRGAVREREMRESERGGAGALEPGGGSACGDGSRDLRGAVISSRGDGERMAGSSLGNMHPHPLMTMMKPSS